MIDEHKLLKTLLLQEELELLEKIKNKVLSDEQFTQEVSDVLVSAVKRSRQQNNRLNIALQEPISIGIQKTFADKKQSIIDSLLPIVGQLIRRTVTNSIKQFVADINRTLDLGFSAKAIKWRWQAYKAGVPFAEMVFQKTIRYQIQEMFLVDRETGLLIEYSGTDNLMKNKDAISSMLTVIQDYIGDSLQLNNSELRSIVIDDNEILISTGPHAYLASVIKGSPTERLKERLQKLIELIHADYGDDFSQQSNFRNLPELANLLEDNLITKSIDDINENKINFAPWLIIIVLLASYLAFSFYQNRLEFNNIQNKAIETPGLFVKSIEKTPSGFLINGLMDPLTDLSKLQKLEVEFHTTPFISLDLEMIQKRADEILQDFPEARLVSTNTKIGEFQLTGKIQEPRLTQLKRRLQLTPGINNILDQTTSDSDAGSDSIDSNPIEQIETELGEQNQNQEQEQEQEQDSLEIKKDLQPIQPIAIDINNLINQINGAKIEMYHISEPEQINNLNTIIKHLSTLLQQNPNTKLVVIGKSDCDKSISNQKSQQRTDKIKTIFKESNLPTENMKFTIEKCRSFAMNRDTRKRTVEFKVEQ